MSESFKYNDGGRADAGYKGDAGDCVTRAIAIATGKPYQEVYDTIFGEIKTFAKTSRSRSAKKSGRKTGLSGTTPRNGVFKEVYKDYLLSLGWKWNPTMQIGQGCKVHLKADELPKGTIIVKVSKHLVTVIDGVINDTYDCSRNGSRCVYGYYSKPEVQPEIKSDSDWRVTPEAYSPDEVKNILQNIYAEFAEAPLHMHTTKHLKEIIQMEVEQRPIKPLKIFKH